MTAFASATSETLVNTTTASTQDNPYVTQLADGGWIVVWDSKTGTSYSDLYYQRYDSTGAAVGGEVQITTTSGNDPREANVAGLIDGGWVISYQGNGSGGDSFGIYQVRYDSTGAVTSTESLVNTTTSPIQVEPYSVALSDGGWLVTWASSNQVSGSSGFDIYQQRYDSSGNQVGGETLVNTTTTGNQLDTAVTVLADGGWVVVWESLNQVSASSGYDIYQQRYDSSGNQVGGDTLVNTTTDYNQLDTAVTVLADGGWLESWSSFDQDGDSFGIYLQQYDSSGSAVGSETQVNTTTADQQITPVVAELAGGGWVVVWESLNQDGDSYGIYMQRYGADGNAIGDETLVNETASGSQSEPSVTALANGSWVVTWEGNGPGDGAGIFQRVFTPTDVRGDDTDNVLSGTSSTEFIFGYAGADVIAAGDGDNIVYGGDDGDFISGGDGTDTLNGDAGADFIRGDGGDDTIDGGVNTDTAIYSGNWSDYTITESGGTYTIIDNRSGSPDGTDTVTNVEFFAFADGTINVSELLNVAPSAIEASALKIDENSAAGTEVATLTGTDGNSLDSFTFALTKDPSGFFEIVGDKLQVKAGAMLDYESARFHKVTIEVSDAAGATHSEKLRIDVTDLAEKIALTNGDDVFKDKGTTETSISAGRGNDQVTGSSRADTIDGGRGRDVLDGRGGDDNISGGKGRDTITGGKGDDTFVFKTGWGKDTIVDFDAKGTHHDRIDLSELDSITSWRDLERHHLSTKGSDVVIDGLNGDVLVLKNINVNHLDSSDFIF